MWLWKKRNRMLALERTGWHTREVPVGEWAARCAEYAILSANVYGTRGHRRLPDPEDWHEVVPERVDHEATGLYYEVWERALNRDAVQVAIVFRGTKFTSLKDWRSNLRWFVRYFLPGEDQYDVVRRQIAGIVERAQQRHGGRACVIATGHSLGGGLAQQAAYAHPDIKQVYAFDPSPVTGFHSVPAPERNRNRVGIVVHRIYEHGEIVAYARHLLKKAMPLSLRDAQIVEVRLDLRGGGPVSQHTMATLALDLLAAAKADNATATEPQPADLRADLARTYQA